MAIAFLALLIALSGTAVALPGKNRVQGNDIRKNAVTGAKVKNESLTGKDVKGLTGADIKESTLGQVPSAASASTASTATTAANATNAGNASAVNGIGVAKVAQRMSENSAPVSAASVAGLTIRTGCSPSGNPVFAVSYSGSAFQTMFELGDGAVHRGESSAGATQSILDGLGKTEATIQMSVGTLDGRAFAFTGHAADQGFGDNTRCTFYGVVTGG
jgi:hypothetical protein